MQKFSVEILDNTAKCHGSKKGSNEVGFYYETKVGDKEHIESTSVLIHGPVDVLGSYSLNGGPKSTKGTFPLTIHSVNPGKYNLKLDVFNLYDEEAESTISLPLNIDDLHDKTRLSGVKLASFIALFTAFIIILFVGYKLVEFQKVKEIVHSLRSPTSLFAVRR